MQKKHMWYVLEFGTICLIIKHKSIRGGTLILVKTAGWSAASLKLTLFLKLYKLSQIQTKAYFQVALIYFTQAF